MFKRLSALLLALLMVCTLMPMVSAEDDGYNDTIIDWGAHTTHVYDDCADLSCNVCGALRVSSHVYTAVETTPPSCSAEGVRTYTCSVCSHSYTESIDRLNHTWNDATCTAPKTCSVCGATEGEALEHSYDNACDADCNVCGATRTVGDHVYDNACDADCNVCGATRTVGDHVYDNACDADCNVCGATRTVGDHVYDNACDADCNVCGATRTVGDHVYDNACDAACNECGATRTVGDHVYDNACDADCNVCGATRTVGDHVYTYPCDSSCDVCGATRDASHDWMDATCTQPRICRVCGSEDGEALGHTYDNACDADCNVCGTTRQVEEHVHGYPCSTVCIICGAAIEPYGHQFDNGCDTTCNFCDFVREVPHTYANDCDAVCTKCGATREVPDHVWVNGSCAVCGIVSPSKVEITKESATAAYAKLGAKVSVKVTADGEGLTYTWYIRNDGKKTYSKSSVTSATYSTTMSSSSKNRRAYCIVTDRYGNSVRSKTFLLREAASITKEPATAAYAKKGAKVSVKITASGDGLKYAWYIKNSGKSTYSKSSLKTATYSTTMSSTVKGRKIYCVVTDKYGKKVQSKTFLLRESVSIVTQPKTVTVKKNATAKVTVKASGDGLKYTWYIKNAGTSKYTKSSLKTATYSAKMTNTVKNRLVYCVVTDKYGKTVKTVTVKLKMK